MPDRRRKTLRDAERSQHSLAGRIQRKGAQQSSHSLMTSTRGGLDKHKGAHRDQKQAECETEIDAVNDFSLRAARFLNRQTWRAGIEFAAVFHNVQIQDITAAPRLEMANYAARAVVIVWPSVFTIAVTFRNDMLAF